MSISALLKQIKVTKNKLKELEEELYKTQKECRHDYSPKYICTSCKYNLIDNLQTNRGLKELKRLKEYYLHTNNKQGLTEIKMICSFHNMLHIGFPNYDRL